MAEMSVSKAWDYAIGLIKVDGLEPTEDFKKYIELEKQGNSHYVRTALVAYNAVFSDIGDKSQNQYLEMIIRDGIENGK